MATIETSAVRSHSDAPSDDHPTVDPDDLYNILANRRRRFVLHYLQYHRESIKLGSLAEQIAAWEHEKPTTEITSQERKRSYTALQQRHLPKLEEAELITFDEREGIIEPTSTLFEFDIYTEIVSENDFPWSQYYLGLSAVSTALMTVVTTGILPVTIVPTGGWGLFCAVAFLVSALAHIYATREMKLGASQTPPELKLSN